MFDIKQFDDWNSLIWNDMVHSARNWNALSSGEKLDFEKVLQNSRMSWASNYKQFSNCPVGGLITNGWVKTDFRGPVFQDSVESVYKLYGDTWTPAEYLIDYYNNCVTQNKNKELGRALVALPSFLREYILRDKLITFGYNVSTPPSSVNAQEHVDLIFHTKGGVDVSVWNYIVTERSLEFLPKKSQKRGRIRDGYNYLAPVYRSTSDVDSLYDWDIPSDLYIDNFITNLKMKPIRFKAAPLHKKSFYKEFRLFYK